MRKLLIPVIAIAAVAGVGLAACQQKQPSSGTRQMQQGAKEMGQGAAAVATHAANAAAAAGSEAKQAASDTAVTAKVKAALAAKTGLSSLDIHVKTENGVVTLSGTVSSSAQKDLAASVAGRVSGVKGVNNQLQVKSGA